MTFDLYIWQAGHLSTARIAFEGQGHSLNFIVRRGEKCCQSDRYNLERGLSDISYVTIT